MGQRGQRGGRFWAQRGAVGAGEGWNIGCWVLFIDAWDVGHGG